MRTLIVEDDCTLADQFETVLGNASQSLDTARTVKDAMELVMRRHYDLVVLDFFLPDGTSAGLSDLVRFRNPKAAIISITGSTVFPCGQHGEMVSCDYFLRKPVPPEELAVIAGHLCGPQTASGRRLVAQG